MDGHHTHGSGGGNEGMVVIVGIIGIVVVVSLPVILAILQAIITILLICVATAGAVLAVRLYMGLRRSHTAGTLPWQSRTREAVQAPVQRPEITASTPELLGHIILTEDEYEEIRRNRYGR